MGFRNREHVIVSPQFVILKDPETRHFAPISPPRLRDYIRSTSVFCSNPLRTAENPGNELLRRLQRLGSRRGVAVRFEREPGKGGHGTLCFGDRLTALQDRRAEILHTMSRQLGRPSGICGRRAIGNCERLRISGADQAEALSEAADCLSKALAGRTNSGEDIPSPSPLRRGQYWVAPDSRIALKSMLYSALRARRM